VYTVEPWLSGTSHCTGTFTHTETGKRFVINLLGLLLLALPALLFVYAYAGYPIILRVSAAFRARPTKYGEPREWPQISISLPVYNEAAQVRAVIESLLRLDYPSDRKQILVISDASSDGTDEIVREFSSRGVELLRLPRRAGKTAAEEAALPLARLHCR
jgi:cellulose synthase/poly-beta-1,6-N-acetylglucosamine synthase-like glycosyltransferase